MRRGFELPPKIGLGTLLDGAIHPGWTWAFVRAEPIVFANVATRPAAEAAAPGDGRDAVTLSTYVNSQFDPNLSWDDVEWFRSMWDGPLVLKGIQSVADAVIAAEHGVEAVALSNHGGRQLDSAPAPIELVAPVVDAVGDRIEVICDGGVRRGSDIVKAVALGATAVHGRPGLPLRPRRRRRARRRPRAGHAADATSAARWRSSARRRSPTSPRPSFLTLLAPAERERDSEEPDFSVPGRS